LVVPDPFSGLYVQADQAIGKQVIAGPLPSVHVAAGGFDRNVNVTQLFITCDAAPRPGIAREFPGILSARVLPPRLDAKLAGLWNRMERPDQLARADIVAANITRRI